MNLRPSGDYFVIVKSSRKNPPLWNWEIRRRPEPLGVILYEGDFTSESAARIAGEKALSELLDRIAQEGD
jgi:hypothetical protein